MAFLPTPLLRPPVPLPRHSPRPLLPPRLSTSQLSPPPVPRRPRPRPSSRMLSRRAPPVHAPLLHPPPPSAPVFFAPTPLPTAPPPPLPPARAAPRAKPARKPHGFWNDLTNVERELAAVNRHLGRAHVRSVPRLRDIAALGRGDLVAAIAKHGGVKRVAAALRWGRSGKTRRPAPHDPARAPRLREKILRRPADYWNDIARVQSAIGAFVAEYGLRGVMPTQRQFYQFDRADLVQAAARHGGLTKLAKSMGLSCRRAARRRQYWADFAVLKDALLEFSDRHCPGCMPTADELASMRCSSIANAVASHGGFPAVANRLGLRARNTKAQGAPRVWDEQKLKVALHTFTIKYFPDLARTQTIPTERQLRMYGRNDLSYAVSKAGGFAVVAKALGLRQKRRGVFRSKAPQVAEAKPEKDGQ